MAFVGADRKTEGDDGSSSLFLVGKQHFSRTAAIGFMGSPGDFLHPLVIYYVALMLVTTVPPLF